MKAPSAIVAITRLFFFSGGLLVGGFFVTGPPKDDVYPLGFRYMNGCCTAVTFLLLLFFVIGCVEAA
jgi:hypothetical protein